MNIIQIIYNNGRIIFLEKKHLDDEEIADLVLEIERDRKVREVIVYQGVGRDEDGNIVFVERSY